MDLTTGPQYNTICTKIRYWLYASGSVGRAVLFWYLITKNIRFFFLSFLFLTFKLFLFFISRMAHFRRDDVSSFEYIDAVPKNNRTLKQKRMWRYIAMAVATLIVVIVVVVVAVVVTNKNKNQTSSTDSNQLVISPYSNMQTIITNNDTSLQQKERIFVIGDIHGCLNEFNDIVTKLNFDPTKDQIILAGDLTSKGPDSVGVIRRAKELGALCVRGNHDDKVVRLKTFENEKGRNAMYPVDATMPEGDVPDPIKFKNYHAAVAL